MVADSYMHVNINYDLSKGENMNTRLIIAVAVDAA